MITENQISILNRMIKGSEYDTSVGSILYDLCLTNAIEYETLHKKCDDILSKRFVETSNGDDLTLACADRGVDRKKATYSDGLVLITGSTGAEIKKGEKVASGTINFIFTENNTIPASGEIKVNVKCEQIGSVGNVTANSIVSFPKTLQGLHSVTNPENFSNGYDEESDEDLKERYSLKVRNPNTSVNDNFYKLQALEVSGVGGAKVISRWDGNNTVKVVIISSEKKHASDELIKDTFDHIQSNRPICVDVTVVSAEEVTVNISVKIAVDIERFTVENVKLDIIENITKYIKDNAFKVKYISYAKIGAIILDSQGVIDYSDLLLNDVAENLIIDEFKVAVFGGVIFG